jgi:hypothetical protein
MDLIFLAAISSPVLAVLAVHIFRDIRGGMRNRQGRCYACGVIDDSMEWVHHRRGGTYKYCDRCRERHGTSKRVAVSAAVIAFLLVFAFGILSGRPVPLWLSIVVLLVVVVSLAGIASLVVRRRSQ